MNQQEEDAFVHTAFHGDYRTMKLEDTFRLAIRAAVAHERERAAKVIRETTANVQNEMMAKLYSLHHVDGAEMLCDKLLVAIKDGK